MTSDTNLIASERSVYVEGDEIATVGENKKAPELPEAPINKEVWPPTL